MAELRTSLAASSDALCRVMEAKGQGQEWGRSGGGDVLQEWHHHSAVHRKLGADELIEILVCQVDVFGRIIGAALNSNADDVEDVPKFIMDGRNQVDRR